MKMMMNKLFERWNNWNFKRSDYYMTYDTFFYKKSFQTTKKKFMELYGVKENSYMGVTISRLYDYYCKDSINLNREYRKYYKKEFKTITDFLANKYNLRYHIALEFSKKNAYMKLKNDSPERNVDSLLDNEIIENLFEKFWRGNNEN